MEFHPLKFDKFVKVKPVDEIEIYGLNASAAAICTGRF